MQTYRTSTVFHFHFLALIRQEERWQDRCTHNSLVRLLSFLLQLLFGELLILAQLLFSSFQIARHFVTLLLPLAIVIHQLKPFQPAAQWCKTCSDPTYNHSLYATDEIHIQYSNRFVNSSLYIPTLIDIIWAMTIVWMIRAKLSELFCSVLSMIVVHNDTHTHMNSS